MDDIDRKILACLQEDATAQIETIAERVGLSGSPCWRRIRKLEAAGYIAARVTLLDRGKMNLRETAFVMIRSRNHSHDWIERFCAVVSEFPEVVEMHRTNGSIDYILRVVVPNVEAFNDVYRRLVSRFDSLEITSSFSMETIKSTTALPVGFAQ